MGNRNRNRDRAAVVDDAPGSEDLETNFGTAIHRPVTFLIVPSRGLLGRSAWYD